MHPKPTRAAAAPTAAVTASPTTASPTGASTPGAAPIPPAVSTPPRPLAGRGTWKDLTLSFDEAEARLPAALAAEGFGIVTQLDLQATFKAKLGIDFPRYRLFGVCNPAFAHQALTTDPRMGLLLPCNVVLRTDPDGRTTLGVIDPLAQLGDEGPLASMAAEVARKLEAVAARLP